MKTKISKALFLLASLAMIGTSCSNSMNGGDLDESNVQKINYDEIIDNEVVLDGLNEDEVWNNKKYLRSGNAEVNASYIMTSYIGNSGLFIYAESEDKDVRYVERNNWKTNTHFKFIFAIDPRISCYKEDRCKTIMIDSSEYSSPTKFACKHKSITHYNTNGTIKGLSVELFVSWEQLGLKPNSDGTILVPNEMRIYSSYYYSTRKAQVEICPAFTSTNPDTYYCFDRNGYIDNSDNILGSNDFGFQKTSGIGLVDGTFKSYKGGHQSAFFKPYSAKLAAYTTISSTGEYFNGDDGVAYPQPQKAGFTMYNQNGFYHSFVLDMRAENFESGNFKRARLFYVTNYPNKVVKVNIIGTYEGLNTPELKLGLIKDGQYTYVLLENNLVYKTKIESISNETNIAVYTEFCGALFKDYSCIDYSSNPDGLLSLINQYAYKFNVIPSDHTEIEVKDFAVEIGGSVVVKLLVETGYELESILLNNKDITKSVTTSVVDSTFTIHNISENSSLEVKTKEIDLTNYVEASGNIKNSSSIPISFCLVSCFNDVFPGIFTYADYDGVYNLNLLKNKNYSVVLNSDGYRPTTKKLQTQSSKIEQNFIIDNYVVGGQVSGPGWTAVSNSSSWDFSRETENVVTVDCRNNGFDGPVYFSEVCSEYAVIDVTITNRTETNSGQYEKDPGAGVLLYQIKNGSVTRGVYNLYRRGFRVRPDYKYNGEGYYHDEAVSSKDLRTIGQPIQYKFIRWQQFIYMFIEGELVYTYKDSNVVGPCAYGFTIDTSHPIQMEFSNYSIKSGEEARSIAQNLICTKLNYDHDSIEITGPDIDSSGRVPYQSSVSIMGKNIPDKKACMIILDGKNCFVSNGNPYLFDFVSKDMIGKIINVKLEDTYFDAYKVSGNTVPNALVYAYSSSGRANTRADAQGHYELCLPNGDYTLYAELEGYMAESRQISIHSADQNNIDLTSYPSCFLDKFTYLGLTFKSSLAFTRGFNEENKRFEVSVGVAGNANNLFFSERTSKIKIECSYTYDETAEKNPGFGFWAMQNNYPTMNPSVRIVVKNNGAYLWRYSDVVRNYQIGENLGASYFKPNETYDLRYIRDESRYIFEAKKSGEDSYIRIVDMEINELRGDSVYGLTLTAGGETKLRAFNFRVSTSFDYE